MSEKYYQSIGRRKTAIAQVRLFPVGSGKVTINNKDIKEYFDTEQLRHNAISPIREVGKTDTVDITVRAVGGGKVGQADAVKMALARVLVKYDESLKAVIKARGLLTRDARKKERKKFGHRGARRSTQWRKR
ncbi:30S ribosomal protein S9 [Patescibacteria group bacterium]|nr:30S ribosomal protein S9 [Patescibacteria group bacterium]MBU4452846.1 30S ribosomal protein S9 [Patescibacteria group bacterium]MCG2687244.1 30S ribosomal protein S9 [Candidatus Parcubacteria bacterium]